MNPPDNTILYWLSAPWFLLLNLLGIDKAPSPKTRVVWHSIDNSHVVETWGNDDELLNSGKYSFVNYINEFGE